MTEESKAGSGDSWFRATFDLIVAAGFLSVIGCLFVAFSVLMGKYELLVLAFVLLGAACVRSLLPAERRRKLEKTAVIGEGLKIFNRLESYYLHHPPRSMFFYLLFPITGVWSFFFGKDRGKQELKAYWGLLQWIIVLLVVGSFGSYYRFYKQFDWQFSLTWLYMELLAVYFLCNFFAVPLSTTSLRLSLEKKRVRLFATTLLSLIILGTFTYGFAFRSNYDNLVPINIMLDKRLAEFKGKVMRQQGKLPLYKSLIQSEETKPYFARILHATQTFLRQQGPQIIQFNQQYALAPSKWQRQFFFAQLNKRYQQRLAPIATMEEHKHFFLTITQTPKEFWALVCIPFRESLFYFFRYRDGKLKLFKYWKSIPSTARRQLRVSWNMNQFVFSQDKRMAQVVVEFMRDKFQRAAENLERLKGLKQSVDTTTNNAQDTRPDVPNKVITPSRSSAPEKLFPSAPGASPAKGKARRSKARDRANRAAGRNRKRRYRKPSPRRPPRGIREIKNRNELKRRQPGPKTTLRVPTLRRAAPRIQWGKSGADSPAPQPPPSLRARPAQKGLVVLEQGRAALKLELQKLNADARRLRQYLEMTFGLKAKGTYISELDAVRALWPRPWKLDAPKRKTTFAIFLKDLTQQHVTRYRKALGHTPRRPIHWKQKTKSLRIRRLQQRINRLEKHYKKTRSMYTWVQLKRFKQELVKIQSNTLDHIPRLPNTPAKEHGKRLYEMSREAYGHRMQLLYTHKILKQQWKQALHNRKHFSVHSAALVSFDYPRALGERLLFDHYGKTPELVQTWWTTFYEGFLTIIMLLFQLSMPFHILLIVYCQLRVPELAEQLTELVSSDEPPPSPQATSPS